MRRDVFQAIADPVRRDIIELLAKGPSTVNTVAEKFDVSRPAISKHLRILKECGMVSSHQEGRERYYKIDGQSLLPAFMWLEKYRQLWESKIDSFEAYLDRIQSKTNNNG